LTESFEPRLARKLGARAVPILAEIARHRPAGLLLIGVRRGYLQREILCLRRIEDECAPELARLQAILLGSSIGTVASGKSFSCDVTVMLPNAIVSTKANPLVLVFVGDAGGRRLAAVFAVLVLGMHMRMHVQRSVAMTMFMLVLHVLMRMGVADPA